jgi:antitoxin VapB
MNMTIRTKTFRSGNSQAIRLPAEIAYAEDGLELEMTRHGEMIILKPTARQTLADACRELLDLPELTHDMSGFERALGREA